MHLRDDGWLEDSFLPSNQLPLLRGMLGKRLINIHRFLSHRNIENNQVGQDLFRKSTGNIYLQLEELPLIRVDDYWYYKQERSLDVRLEPEEFEEEKLNKYGRRLTLEDKDYVDERLYSLIGEDLVELHILIRKHELRGDQYRALQAGLQLNFENGTSIIICLRLGVNYGDLTILYPEEIRWDAVKYKIDVTKGRLPWKYRLRRWFWRAMFRSESHSD